MPQVGGGSWQSRVSHRVSQHSLLMRCGHPPPEGEALHCQQRGLSGPRGTQGHQERTSRGWEHALLLLCGPSLTHVPPVLMGSG